MNTLNPAARFASIGLKLALPFTHLPPLRAWWRRLRFDRAQAATVACFMQQIPEMPIVRAERVRQVRDELEAGTYGIDVKLDAALDRMLDELLAAEAIPARS